MPKRKSSKLGWVTFLIAIIALGFAGYSVFSPTIFPSPKTSVYVENAYAAPVSVYTTVNFDAVIFDTHNAYDLLFDVYKAPQKGYYMVIGQVTGTQIELSHSLRINIYVNSIDQVLTGSDYGNTLVDEARASTSGVIWLEKGWNVTMKYYTPSITGEIDDGEASTYLTIYKVD